jgi:hypothetical protein
MVFDSLDNAILFKEYLGYNTAKIYKVEALGISKKGMLLSFYDVIINFDEILKLKRNKKKYLQYNEKSPKGTLFASKVKLIEEVKL